MELTLGELKLIQEGLSRYWANLEHGSIKDTQVWQLQEKIRKEEAEQRGLDWKAEKYPEQVRGF